MWILPSRNAPVSRHLAVALHLLARAIMGAGLFLLSGTAVADDSAFVMQAGRLATAPQIDGVVDDIEWQGAGEVADLVQFTPANGESSPFSTEMRFGFDDEAVYIAFICVDPETARIAAAITTRDGDLGNDDSVGVLLDTFDDDHTGYFFVTNLLGTQQDGRLADNGRSVDSRWDATWRSAAVRVEGGWSAEMAIPLRTLKYTAGEEQVWGVNFVRHVPRRLETSTWAGPVEATWRVSQAGSATGLDLARGTGKRWNIIPYALATTESGGSSSFEVGGTARYRISSSVFAEATINPDFAIIEADVERINLTRFELSVPEKRPFFLEGNERFSQRIRQFYSRRIGEIPWGAKATGTVGSTDFVAIAAQSEPQTANGGVSDDQSDATYAVARAQQGIFGSSNVGLLVANRRDDGENEGSVGIDTTMFFSETLGMTGQLIRVHGGDNDGGLAWFLRPAFDSATTHFHVRYTNLDEKIKDAFNTVGFMRDDNRREFDTNFTHTFWFDEKKVEKVRAGVNYNRYWGQDGVLRSYELDAEVKVELASRWYADLEYTDEFQRFEKDYWNTISVLEVGYDTRAGRSFEIGVGDGVNFDSDLRLYTAEVRFQLSDRWNAFYELTRLELRPDPDGDTTWIHIFSSDYYFTNDLYVKLFVQTNSAITKENVQALFVWRFKPPFGSLQVAYQRGTSELGQQSRQGDTLFSKLAWVF